MVFYWINHSKAIAFPCELGANAAKEYTGYVIAEIEVPCMRKKDEGWKDFESLHRRFETTCIEAKATDISLRRPQNMRIFNKDYCNSLHRGYVEFLNLEKFDLNHGDCEEVTYFEYFTKRADRCAEWYDRAIGAKAGFGRSPPKQWINVYPNFNLGGEFETKIYFNGKEEKLNKFGRRGGSPWPKTSCCMAGEISLSPGDRIEVVVFDAENYDPWVTGNPYKTLDEWKGAIDTFAPYFEDRYIIDLLASFVNPIVAKLVIVCRPTKNPMRKYEAIRDATDWGESKMIVDMDEYLS